VMTLVYRVYDMAGELVQSPASGQAGTNLAQWDASGVASGMYIAVVDALNAQGGLVGRQRLKIVVIH
jgi:hypothetical protein